MSYTTIESFKDFNFIIQDDIYLSGKKDVDLDKEVYNNCWKFSLGDNFIKECTIVDLEKFFKLLFKQRKKQIKTLNLQSDVTFYLWIDELARQLRFNFISGKNVRPPFGCTLHILKTPDPILKKFLNDEKKYHEQGGHILFKDMKFFEPGDPGFDDIDEPDPKDWIQDVYVTTITWKSLLKE